MSALRTWMRQERAREHREAETHVYELVDRNGFRPRYWSAWKPRDSYFWEDDPEYFGVHASVLLPLIRAAEQPEQESRWVGWWSFTAPTHPGPSGSDSGLTSNASYGRGQPGANPTTKLTRGPG